MNEQSKHQLVRFPDLSEAECPLSRIEVVFLFIKLQKELGVYMDLRTSYHDPTAIQSPGWKVLSGGQKPDGFSVVAIFLSSWNTGRYCTADIERKERSEGTDHFFLLSPNEMMQCTC